MNMTRQTGKEQFSWHCLVALHLPLFSVRVCNGRWDMTVTSFSHLPQACSWAA